ncbi:EIN3-binding F-box protein 1-like [Lotus japonicus]|uniref:EIN3-binding F-box protein 1-like n=1 Tax=Lotus japonicus TaxID=34305 RepID=UPI002587303E|nr:EIN3-binding F-box protein 1-like [Lotus japonicus]
MSQVFSFSGNDDFYSGESLYPNPKEANLFLSLGLQVEAYFPLPKRSRIAVPFGIKGNWFDFEQKQETCIETLPDECLFEILRRLPAGQDRGNCMSVSKRWLMLLSNICENEICGNKSTGNENGEQEEGDLEFGNEGFLTRSFEGEKATDVRVAAMSVGTASRGGLGKLAIRGCNSDRPVTDVGLKAIAHGCPSLKILTLWCIPTISDEGLIEIANRCHQLEKLELGQCPNISGKAFVAIAKNCPSLTHFSIESCPNIGNGGLQAIGKCPNLKSVSIKDCAGVGDQGIAGLISSASFVLERVVLESLAVSDLALAVIGHYGIAVTDLVLNCLPNVSEKGFWVMGNGRGLQKLAALGIVSCRGVTDIGLVAIGKGCPNMKIFQLQKCAFLSDNGLVSFAKAAPSIESLYLEECHRITQLGFFGLLFNCAAKLKVLSLASCYGIKNLNLRLPAVLPCGSIESLSIHDCPGFGDATIAVLGKLCPQLEHVELNGLSGITDAGFLPLLESSGAGLVNVNLSGCTKLTDQVVLSLVKLHGCSLEVLNLNGCKKISDASLIAIAGSCPLLSDLDVSRCGITDTGIAALAHGKQLNLKVLSLAGCTSVSNKGVRALKKLGSSLDGLNIKNCKGISYRSLDMLVQDLWSCDILF